MLALVACGGKSATKVAVGTGAEIAPASSIAFVSVNVDRSKPQWQQAAGLAARVPALKNALDRLSTLGICAGAVQPRIGKTVDVAVLAANGSMGEGVVVMTKPKDMAVLKSLVPSSCCALSAAGCTGKKARAHGGANATSSRKVPALVTREQSGWLLAARSEAVLDRFTSEAKKGTLSGSNVFRSAFGSLSKDALVRVYLRGDEILRLAASRLSGGVLGTVSAPAKKHSPLKWIAFSLRPGAGALRLDGTVAGIEAKNATNPLPGEAPAASLVAAIANGSSIGLGEAVDNFVARNSKLFAQLGIGSDDLLALNAARLTLSLVDEAPPSQSCEPSPADLLPLSERSGFALELSAPGLATTARKVERLLPSIASQLEGNLRSVTISGSHAHELTVGAVRLYAGVAADKIYLASAPSAVSPPAKLWTTAAFQRAKRALPVPAENAGVLYANLERAGETLAVGSASMEKGNNRAGCPQAGTSPLKGLSALLVYLNASGDRIRLKGVATVG